MEKGLACLHLMACEHMPYARRLHLNVQEDHMCVM